MLTNIIFIDDFFDAKMKAAKLEAKLDQLIISINTELIHKSLTNNRKIGLRILKNSIKGKLVKTRQARKTLDNYMLSKLFGDFTNPEIWEKQKERFETTLKTINEIEL